MAASVDKQDAGTYRRQFLKTSAATIAASALSSCGWRLAEVKSNPRMQGDSDLLYIYTWAGYTDQDLLDRFYDETGIKVVADVFDSNESMLARVQAGGGGAYSIIYPSDYMVQKMESLGLLTELDHSLILGLDDLFPEFQDPIYDRGNTYSVPISWGTTGLIYNRKLLPTAPTDWEYLWENQDLISKRLTLVNDVREVMGCALRKLGYSYNSTNVENIRGAYQELLILRPAIASFTTDGWRSQILVEDLLIAMCYSSDAAEIKPENEDLEYITPRSGSSLWTDTLVIPTNAPNPDGAYQWINFMLQPDIAAEIVERLSFATPSREAYRRLSEELKEDPTLFPPESIIEKCESLAPLGEYEEVYDEYWTKLRSG
ncbi:spermidine/putrescine ABC transporter substrate-binding protein [Okeania sp. SIO1I7]|uniref:polyamine ABC transporter substrate-binding protein n=1 Tax=Okeania sp. SIO1I7 TaxID=2607772 RepID=UPI0013FB7118|nr:spermidine/putrescine ABC transporter substrate-binding protein [Okeania sp. SIO1I7]NET24620.1 spermidine/putrescine ABC transporter substrate-binding protein [Okeania sp. SIO1I7]